MSSKEGWLQWRTEGLQRPGANACIGAPPPELAFRQLAHRQAKKKKKKKGKERPPIAPSFKIRPYKLGRRPLQGLRPGAMAPLPPPSARHWVVVYLCVDIVGVDIVTRDNLHNWIMSS